MERVHADVAHAAAQTRALRVEPPDRLLLPAPVDGLREPALRVLDEDLAHGAELTGAHALGGLDDEGVGAIRMREPVQAAANFELVAQLETFGEGSRRRLVGEHVKAVLE